MIPGIECSVTAVSLTASALKRRSPGDNCPQVFFALTRLVQGYDNVTAECKPCDLCLRPGPLLSIPNREPKIHRGRIGTNLAQEVLVAVLMKNQHAGLAAAAWIVESRAQKMNLLLV